MPVSAVAVLLNASLPLPDFVTKDFAAISHRLLVVTLILSRYFTYAKTLSQSGLAASTDMPVSINFYVR
jgi:hypothetical protein